MGSLATPEALVLRWDEVLRDPSLQDLPIVSPSNVQAEIDEKTRAYLAAGAHEVWIASEGGSIRYFSLHGELARSGFGISVSLPAPLP